ncbi:hypothetical protein GHT06_010918 [Daphnia sinensis]|uniref:C1q domain-containing protein n=1 Tax=Daphnia sinensis TaxID=1820382 RepID=A0AAD5LIP6_9CRUS|nr:hypothetical protein GHT06_010918 [Daphnia sinensis]
MNNLATLILSVLMASSVFAQIPTGWPKQTTFLSAPYYVYNHQVIPTQPKAPVLHQNDPFTPQRDAIVSVLLRELKEMSKRLAETNVVVENVKNELAQLKKMAGAEGSKGQSNGNGQSVTEIKSQAELIAFANITVDSDDKATPSARFCNCLRLTYVTNTLTDDLAEEKLKLSALSTKFDVSTAPTTIDKIPESCADLKSLGHHRSGIYSVMGVNQVESVYCDFTKSDTDDFQKMIGIVDTKTMRVYFHAQRTSDYDLVDTVIPFDELRTNDGDAMTTEGVFTAPTPGTYFFAYSGIGLNDNNARVDMEMKAEADAEWSRVGRGYAAAGSYETYSLQSTLRLGKGDQIRLYLAEGKIHDASFRYTNFVERWAQHIATPADGRSTDINRRGGSCVQHWQAKTLRPVRPTPTQHERFGNYARHFTFVFSKKVFDVPFRQLFRTQAVWIASAWMACVVCAQWPADWSQSFPPTPRYDYKHPVIAIQQNGPIHHRHSQEYMLYGDSVLSVMRQELKEIANSQAEMMAENVKKKNDLSNMKRVLVQIKQMGQDKVEAKKIVLKGKPHLKSSQLHFENVTIDNDIKATSRDGSCQCQTILYYTQLMKEDLAEINAKLNGLTTQFGASTSPTSINKMPGSCAELKQLGYTNSGIFFIKGINQVESVYCDFTKQVGAAGFQNVIGIVDVKTRRIYFHAQRDSVYSTAGTVPFNLLRFNEGNSINPGGIFSAPVPGTYYFALSGISTDNGNARVELHLNKGGAGWNSIGRAVGTGVNFQTFAIHATLELDIGDQIKVVLVSGTIQDSSTHNTNFIGYLIDEQMD